MIIHPSSVEAIRRSCQALSAPCQLTVPLAKNIIATGYEVGENGVRKSK